ncbi:hypothetical protein JOQ06_008355 [Pogonophryne albipinna]|uniref:Uncharacterized protein n=1 Tax=Pogonophryne albipinna TaxID=1090488 RepID=A0AAD6F9Y9_9TELE|nr:hypothetical protein JOQ06_008355 [Pogonophryne albipinna]
MGDIWCFDNDSDISDMIAPVDQDLNKVISEVCHSYLFPEDLETEADGFEEADKPLQDTDPANTLEVPEPPKQVEVPEPTKNLDVPEPPQTLEVPDSPQTLEVPEPESEMIEQTLVYLDDLMNRDDLMKDKEVTSPWSYSTMSDDSMGDTWCFDNDSDISDMIAPVDQDLNKVISEVCHSYLFPEDLETEADGFEEADKPLQDTDPANTLEVPEPPKQVEVPEPTKNLDVPESPQTLEVPESPQTLEVPEPPQTLEVPESPQTLEVPESPQTLEVPEPPQTLEVPEPPQTLEVPESPNTLEVPEPPKTLEVPEPPQTLEVPEPHQTLEVPEPHQTLEVPEPPQTLEVPEPPQTLEVPEPHQTLEVPEPTKNLEVPESPNTLEVPESPTTQTMVMRLPSDKGKKERSQWRRSFSRWRKRKTQPLEHLDAPFSYASADLTSRSSGEYKQGSLCPQETPSTTSCNAASRSIPLQLVDIEDKDQTPGAIRNDSSLSSASSITLVHQFTDSDDEDDETLSQISVVQCQPDSERLSKNKDDVEENKAKRSSNCFSRFFRSIFSKNEKDNARQPAFWKRLVCCTCLDR